MEAQSKMRESVKEKKVQKRYDEEFKRQAVEPVIHSGRSQAQIARELGVSEYSLTLWKRAYLGHLKPGSATAGEVTFAHQTLIDPTKLMRHSSQSLRTKKSFGFHR